MKKIIASTIFMAILLTISFFLFLISFFLFLGMINQRVSEAESLIGERIVMDGDTLQIIDHSILNDTYILNNGVEIHVAFIEKVHVIPPQLWYTDDEGNDVKINPTE